MDFKKHPNGIYYKLSKDDFKFGDAPGFRKAVKKLKSAAWPCPEIKTDDWREWGFIGKADFKEFGAIKKFFIDDQKNDRKQLAEMGFKPLLRTEAKFRRRAIVRKPPGV